MFWKAIITIITTHLESYVVILKTKKCLKSQDFSFVIKTKQKINALMNGPKNVFKEYLFIYH